MKGMVKVKLTYFKSTSGKYYSGGEIMLPDTLAMFEIFEHIRHLQELRWLPDLVKGAYGYHVLVECPEHENAYPGLLLYRDTGADELSAAPAGAAPDSL